MVALIETLLEQGPRLPHRRRLDLLPHRLVARLRRAGPPRPDRSSASASASRPTSTARTTCATSRSGRAPSRASRAGRPPIGDGPARLAHRVLGDEHALPRAQLRHPHRRHRPRLPAPRGRDRAVGGGHRPAVRADLAALRPPPDGRPEDGQADRQHRASGRHLRRGHLAARAALRAAGRPLPGSAGVQPASRWPRPPPRSNGCRRCSRRSTRYREERPDDADAAALLRSTPGSAFEAALDDDLNISPALAAVFELVRELNRRVAERDPVDRRCARGRPPCCATATACWRLAEDDREALRRTSSALLEERAAARAARDWARSDALRDELGGAGRRWSRTRRRTALAPRERGLRWPGADGRAARRRPRRRATATADAGGDRAGRRHRAATAGAGRPGEPRPRRSSVRWPAGGRARPARRTRPGGAAGPPNRRGPARTRTAPRVDPARSRRPGLAGAAGHDGGPRGAPATAARSRRGGAGGTATRRGAATARPVAARQGQPWRPRASDGGRATGRGPSRGAVSADPVRRSASASGDRPDEPGDPARRPARSPATGAARGRRAPADRPAPGLRGGGAGPAWPRAGTRPSTRDGVGRTGDRALSGGPPGAASGPVALARVRTDEPPPARHSGASRRVDGPPSQPRAWSAVDGGGRGAGGRPPPGRGGVRRAPAGPPPAGRARAPRRARAAGAARDGAAHPGRRGRGRHAHGASRLRRPPGRRAGGGAAPWATPRRRPGARPRARRAALRAGARLARGPPERGHAAAQRRGAAASTASCSRRAARRRSARRPSRRRRALSSTCCWCPLDDLGGGLVDLHARGLRIVGADEAPRSPTAKPTCAVRWPSSWAARAMASPGTMRRRIDLVVRIPMRGQVASLNAAVAGSVLLFEAAAQRAEPGDAAIVDGASGPRRGDGAPSPDETPDRRGSSPTPAPLPDGGAARCHRRAGSHAAPRECACADADAPPDAAAAGSEPRVRPRATPRPRIAHGRTPRAPIERAATAAEPLRPRTQRAAAAGRRCAASGADDAPAWHRRRVDLLPVRRRQRAPIARSALAAVSFPSPPT